MQEEEVRQNVEVAMPVDHLVKGKATDYFFLAVEIAFGVADALGKMCPAPDLPGAADWKWEEYKLIPTTPADADLLMRDKFSPNHLYKFP